MAFDPDSDPVFIYMSMYTVHAHVHVRANYAIPNLVAWPMHKG